MSTKLPEINIGLIGHVDHGKTTLTSALSGKWTDIHSEELKRGITIKLGYADFDIRKCKKCDKLTTSKDCPKCKSESDVIRRLSIVDAPGHESLMAIMISGAAIMDGAILLVAANEPCPQPQTLEHLMALKILGIENVIIVQNKVDIIPKGRALENYKAIKEFTKKILGKDVPIIPLSAQKKVNIDIVLEAIEEFLPTPERTKGQDPLMLIARSFDINKPGTSIDKLHGGVLGGMIRQGEFKVGDEIVIKPGLRQEKRGQTTWEPLKTEITSIVCGSQKIDKKGPGGSVAMATKLDPSLTRGDSFSGNLIGSPNKLPETQTQLEFQANIFEHAIGLKETTSVEKIKMSEPLMLSIGTSTTLGVVTRAAKTIKVNLKRPVCAKKGDKLAISRQIQNRWRLIGFGTLI
jgi:translation initiation factor 2 subunit 3